MRRVVISVIILICCSIVACYTWRYYFASPVVAKRDNFLVGKEKQENKQEKQGISTEISYPDPEQYRQIKVEVANKRLFFQKQYLQAKNAKQREIICHESSQYLEQMLPKMMFCWLNTPWHFHGTSVVPGKGKIACGYYVAVILRDAGFKINRIRVAQQASQKIILTIVRDKTKMWINSRYPYQKYQQKILQDFNGINIVGLDFHVGFIVVKNNEMRFVHADFINKKVVNESAENAKVLKKSRYRVIANITRNHEVIKRWLLGKDLPCPN